MVLTQPLKKNSSQGNKQGSLRDAELAAAQTTICTLEVSEAAAARQCPFLLASLCCRACLVLVGELQPATGRGGPVCLLRRVPVQDD